MYLCIHVYIFMSRVYMFVCIYVCACACEYINNIRIVCSCMCECACSVHLYTCNDVNLCACMCMHMRLCILNYFHILQLSDDLHLVAIWSEVCVYGSTVDHRKYSKTPSDFCFSLVVCTLKRFLVYTSYVGI